MFLATGLPDILALGEPAHTEPAFPRRRNQIFEDLVARGFRSIAVESDRIAGLAVDDHVRGDGPDPGDAGFSYGFGIAANRELVTWMREYNASVAAADRLAFHGFDAPLDMARWPGPGPYLRHACDYLHRPADPGGLLGDDDRWSDPAALTDPAASVGRSAEAAALAVAPLV